MILMGICKVCKSINRHMYEEYRIKYHRSYKDLQNIALNNGEHISHGTFRKHFKEKHIPEERKQLMKKGMIKPVEATPSKAKKEILTTIKMVEQLQGHVNSANALMRTLLSVLKNQSNPEPKMISSLTNLMTEVRRTIELLPKLIDNLKIKSNIEPEDIINSIARLFNEVDLSMDQVVQLEAALERLRVAWQ